MRRPNKAAEPSLLRRGFTITTLRNLLEYRSHPSSAVDKSSRAYNIYARELGSVDACVWSVLNRILAEIL